MKKFFPVAVSVLLLSTSAGADFSMDKLNEKIRTITQESKAKLVEGKERVTDMLEREERERYEYWGLSKEEWDAYKKAMDKEWKYQNPNLDPLTALGVSTNDPALQKRYARMLVEKEYERVGRELAFQRAYDEAFLELHPNEPNFDLSLIEDGKAKIKAGERVLYFARADCVTNECLSDFKRLFEAVWTSDKTGLDIYFVGAKNDQEIQAWAKAVNLPPEDVKNKKITLNYDKGYFLRYAKGQIPYAFLMDKANRLKKIPY